MKILLWIFFFPIMAFLWGWKKNKLVTSIVTAILLVFGMALGGVEPENGRISDIKDSTELVQSTPMPTAEATVQPAEEPDTGTNNASIEDKPEQIPSNDKYVPAKVVKHVDGDTVYVRLPDGTEHSIRFIGINCPESTTKHEPYGTEASNYTKEQLLGKTIYLEKDVSETDKYGRLMRYIWLEPPKENSESEIRSKMFNAILVLNGYAQAATYQPDSKYSEFFVKFTEEARQQNKGLWGLENKEQTANNTSKQSAAGKENKVTGQGKYYWTPNGKSYHTTPHCRTLANAKKILSGTLDEAKAAGKYDPCNVCN